MNKQQLAMLDDISYKIEKRVSEQVMRKDRSEAKTEGVVYNPIVHLELSQFKKHNSVAPLKKDVSNIDFKRKDSDDVAKGELVMIKSKRNEKDLSKDKGAKNGKDEDSPEKKKEVENHEKKQREYPFLKTIDKFLDSAPVIIFMTLLTIFAMFASDVQAAFLPTSIDFKFDCIQCILVCLFSLEIFLACISKKNYIGSFFFWLDVISTLSLLQDISFVLDSLLTGYSSLNPPATFDLAAGNSTLSVKAKSSSQATNSLAKLSSATRATRVLRIIRIVRLIRIVKLYKSAVLARANIDKRKKEKERIKAYKDAMEASGQSDENSRSLVRIDNNPPETPDNNEVGSPDLKRITENDALSNLRLKDGNKKLTKHTTDLNKKEEKKKKKKDDNSNEASSQKSKKRRNRVTTKQVQEKVSMEDLINESKISKVLSELITKKVIILILAMLITLPILQDNFYIDDALSAYVILAKYIQNDWDLRADNFLNYTATEIRLPNNILTFMDYAMDPIFPIISVKLQDTYVFKNTSFLNSTFRSSETKSCISSDGFIIVKYSSVTDTSLSGILNMFQTLFVCMCLTLAAVSFEQDTQELVLQPLEIMIEIVDAVARDPINAKNVENLQKGVKSTMQKIGKKKGKEMTEEQYEVKVIEGAIIKISALLAIGFGEAGGEIIKENLSSNSELNAMLKGKKKTAIFGFCDIRNFPIVNEALQERTMVFVNEIAEIVHSSVDMYGGAANKNIGDAFLMVWKFKNDEESNVSKAIKDNVLEFDPDSPVVQRISDMSVLGFVNVLIRINKDMRVLAYRTDPDIGKRLTNFKVKMGFGLHLGWAIEGAIGSSYKIDASYLSPNVNMSARLEAATRIYGVNILLSGPLFDKLSEDMKEICRLVDVVTVKGSVEPMRLYTIDLNLNLLPQKSKVPKGLATRAQRSKHAVNKLKLVSQSKSSGGIAKFILSKNSFREALNTGRSRKFYSVWKEGLDHYFKGRWEEAGKMFADCLGMCESDGPCKTLLSVLKNNNFTAPSKWKGVRELTSKT